MKKSKKQFICTNCGSVFSKWSGKCFECGAWDSIEEEILQSTDSKQGLFSVPDPLKAIEIESFNNLENEPFRLKTPISELNRVMGGGLVPGSVTLIGGDPGIGKSTILLQLSLLLSNKGTRCLYVTGEESSNQVKLRARRLNYENSDLGLLPATNINNIIASIENTTAPGLVIIDSIQTIYSEELSSAPGTVTQIRQCSQKLINYAKSKDIAIILVGHVTKDGELAGPKILEHMVDTVLYLEGDQNNQYRILRSVKNRFGSINEIGVFEMTGFGMSEVKNPSELFLMERENNVSGTAVFAGLEGSRPILVEVQALVAPSFIPTPRRSAVGWDHNRLSMILAVLGVRFGLNLSGKDVYLSITGGLKITEPAIDLAVAAALISASYNQPLPNNSIFFGEIGLSGEIRKVTQAPQRINEAKKQGYKNIFCGTVVYESEKDAEEKIKIIKHIKQLKSIIQN